MSELTTLGKTKIKHGKHERNYFIWFPSHRCIMIDFDSDYHLTYDVNVKNPKKAYEKAQKVVDKVGDTTTVKELEKLGFSHDIPKGLF